MSAYIVNDSTINNIVNTLAGLRDFEYERREIKENGYDLDEREGRQLLAVEMFKLNIAGVDARYGEGEAKTFRPLDFTYKQTLPTVKIQLYKSLSCFLYQCAEGDIYKDNGLYAILERIKSSIAENIIHALPEYDKAKWE